MRPARGVRGEAPRAPPHGEALCQSHADAVFGLEDPPWKRLDAKSQREIADEWLRSITILAHDGHRPPAELLAEIAAVNQAGTETVRLMSSLMPGVFPRGCFGPGRRGQLGPGAPVPTPSGSTRPGPEHLGTSLARRPFQVPRTDPGGAGSSSHTIKPGPREVRPVEPAEVREIMPGEARDLEETQRAVNRLRGREAMVHTAVTQILLGWYATATGQTRSQAIQRLALTLSEMFEGPGDLPS